MDNSAKQSIKSSTKIICQLSALRLLIFVVFSFCGMAFSSDRNIFRLGIGKKLYSHYGDRIAINTNTVKASGLVDKKNHAAIFDYYGEEIDKYKLLLGVGLRTTSDSLETSSITTDNSMWAVGLPILRPFPIKNNFVFLTGCFFGLGTVGYTNSYVATNKDKDRSTVALVTVPEVGFVVTKYNTGENFLKGPSLEVSLDYYYAFSKDAEWRSSYVAILGNILVGF